MLSLPWRRVATAYARLCLRLHRCASPAVDARVYVACHREAVMAAAAKYQASGGAELN
jgi:hypothetical protein